MMECEKCGKEIGETMTEVTRHQVCKPDAAWEAAEKLTDELDNRQCADPHIIARHVREHTKELESAKQLNKEEVLAAGLEAIDKIREAVNRADSLDTANYLRDLETTAQAAVETRIDILSGKVELMKFIEMHNAHEQAIDTLAAVLEKGEDRGE